MIHKIDKGNYYLVFAGDENGKPNGNRIQVKGYRNIHSQATELKEHPREYIEVLEKEE